MRRLSENGTIGLNDGRPAVVSAVPSGLIGDLEFCALGTVHALVIKIVGALVPSAPAFDTNAATVCR